MNKFSIYAVLGRGHIVINSSNGTELFSGTLEECIIFKNKQ